MLPLWGFRRVGRPPSRTVAALKHVRPFASMLPRVLLQILVDKAIAMLPSPTAEATPFTGLNRTSHRRKHRARSIRGRKGAELPGAVAKPSVGGGFDLHGDTQNVRQWPCDRRVSAHRVNRSTAAVAKTIAENTIAATDNRSAKRNRASAVEAACSSVAIVLWSCVANSLMCASFCDAADCSSAT